MAKPNEFDIPRIYYFESKNIFTGSRKDFNFRIVPEEGELRVTIWHGFICSELAEPEGSSSFPLSAEGHEQMLAWLKEQYNSGGETT
ncbi:MAG: hypothetical protein IKN55_02640 [Oscillospiraceae bacterium]|nr:hypothetical protein [Oscillospiraceae bacterium]